MSTPFKTPSSQYLKARSHKKLYTPKSTSERSDSDESVTSEGSNNDNGSTFDLTVIAMFDDLRRLTKRDGELKPFLHYCEQMRTILDACAGHQIENEKLRNLLELKTQECSETEKRLQTARQILDEEKKKMKLIAQERDDLEEQLDQVRDLLFKDNRVPLVEEARDKLAFLQKKYEANCNGIQKLSCIQEINSTGSMLSDFSISRSEDDLDGIDARPKRVWNKGRPSTCADPDPPQKKRRSSNRIIEIGPSDTVRATTTVTVNKTGPITATAIIESVPKGDICTDTEKAPSSDDGLGSTAPSAPPSHLVFESWARNDNNNYQGKFAHKPHALQPKAIVLSELCVCCEKKIRFGKGAVKCKDCRSICHDECKDKLPLPCVPTNNTPNKHFQGTIADFAPTTPPMVPALIIHCANEIELRGLNELGIYRIPGSEKEVKALKEKFLKGRGAPSISQIDIHVLCGCIKDFLRSLSEPLITYQLWHDFVRAVQAKDYNDVLAALYQCVAELPQPNRDTLAYMMLHLQKVAESPECKMPLENLAKVFGPTIINFSCTNPKNNDLLSETAHQIAVMEQLLRIPSNYWSVFIGRNGSNGSHTPSAIKLKQTPSTDSVIRLKGRYLTPNTTRTGKSRKYFATPPHK